MKREIWMASKALKGAIETLNALFCSSDKEKQISKKQKNQLVNLLCEDLSQMMLEDAYDIIKEALKQKTIQTGH